jgi:hypothetical protein
VLILENVTNIGLQIFETCTFYIFVTFNQCSLVCRTSFFAFILSQFVVEFLLVK